MKAKCYCRVCGLHRKIKEVQLIPTSKNDGLQVQIIMNCNHTKVFQVELVPIGGR